MSMLVLSMQFQSNGARILQQCCNVLKFISRLQWPAYILTLHIRCPLCVLRVKGATSCTSKDCISRGEGSKDCILRVEGSVSYTFEDGILRVQGSTAFASIGCTRKWVGSGRLLIDSSNTGKWTFVHALPSHINVMWTDEKHGLTAAVGPRTPCL